MANKDNSLLQIARDTMAKKRGAQKLELIIKEVFQQKGITKSRELEYKGQFVLDFMSSGYFVYCGDGKWNLKERESISVLDHDGGLEYIEVYDEEAERNELKEDIYEEVGVGKISVHDDDDDEDEDDDQINVEEELLEELGGEEGLILDDEDPDLISDEYIDEEDEDIFDDDDDDEDD